MELANTRQIKIGLCLRCLMTKGNYKMMTQNKRIAIFMPSLFGAGGQRSMLNLAHGIADCGYPVDLVLAQAEGEFLSEVRKPVHIVDLKASRALTSLPSLVQYLRNQQPAAMLSVFGYVNVIALWAWRMAGVKTRLFVNEQNTVSVESGNAARWRGRMTPRLIKRFYPWADGIVVVSQGVADDLAHLTNIPEERITVIYNPSVIGCEVLEKAQEPLNHPWFEPDQPPGACSCRSPRTAKRLSYSVTSLRPGAEGQVSSAYDFR